MIRLSVDTVEYTPEVTSEEVEAYIEGHGFTYADFEREFDTGRRVLSTGEKVFAAPLYRDEAQASADYATLTEDI